MPSPDWLSRKREPGLPNLTAPHGAAPDMTTKVAGLVDAATEKLRAQANATVTEAAIRAANDPTPPQPQGPTLETVGRVIDIANGLSDIQHKALQGTQAEVTSLREASAHQYDKGYATAAEQNKFVLDLFVKTSEREAEQRRFYEAQLQEERTRADALVRDLNSKLEAISLAQKEAEIERLKAENEKLKSNPTQQQPQVPLVGMQEMKLPDGRTVFVANAAQGPGDIERLKSSVGQLRELSELVDSIRGPQRQGYDPENPDHRWRHSLIDDWEESRREERQQKAELNQARVEREKALAGVVGQAPKLLSQLARPLIDQVPEQGAVNGVGVDTPPPRRRVGLRRPQEAMEG